MRKIALLLCLLLCFSMTSCQAGETVHHAEFFLMDTTVGITLYGKKQTAEEAFSQCRQLLSSCDCNWARQNPDSWVARFNSPEVSEIEVPQDSLALLRSAFSESEENGGAFDITVAPLCDLWQTAGDRDSLPTDAEMETALSHVGMSHLTLDGTVLKKDSPQVQIDLGGIGKGAAISLVLDCLKAFPLTGGFVTFGSNVAVFGQKPDREPFRIGIKDPKNPQGQIGYVELHDGEILSVSGDYERYVTVEGRNYHHILDPATGYPASSGYASVIVIADDGARADALSTALFVLGDRGAEKCRREKIKAIFVSSEGEITVTDEISESFRKK